jgi:hypothetical protein
MANDHANTVTIIVNGTEKTVNKKETLTFEEVVALADGLPSGPMIEYTVTYRRGHGDKPEGSLVPGKDVKVKGGMIFNVTATDRS